jgi:phage minor structural protein
MKLATQVKLFAAKEDFRRIGIQDFAINPYFYHNGKDWIIDGSGLNTFKYNGTPTFVEGKRGTGFKVNGGSALWSRAGMPVSNKYAISLWVKLSAQDLQSSAAWKILATSRGHSTSGGTAYPNKGIHIAVYNQDTKGGVGTLNVRFYGTTSVDMYSSQGVIGSATFNFQPDQWYHIYAIYDQTAARKCEVYVNGQLILYNASDPNLTAGWSNSFTVGDMLTTSGGGQYPFYGTFDDVIYLYGDNVWTPVQAQDYYNRVMNGSFLDYETTDGSLQLGKNSTGSYSTSPVSWDSDVIDLGNDGFVDFGLVQAVGTIPSGTSLTFYTRTSADAVTWNNWTQVKENGEIQSTNQRYLQVRVVFQSSNSVYTPTLDSVEILEDKLPELPNTLVRADDPLYLYEDLEGGLSSLGVLKNAYDIIIEEQINGEDNLTFKLPKNDKKRKEIGEEPVEMIAVIGNRYYVVKEVIDKRDDDGKLYSEFTCEALWTELRDWYVDGIEVVEVDAKTALETIVSSIFRELTDPEFDWTVGIVEVRKKRTLRSDWSDVLSLVRSVQETWGGEILFDTKNKVIHLLNQIGKDVGVRFYYNKNLKNIERTIDTYDLVTRIYPTGAGGLDITTVNNGVPYLENMTWVNKLNLRRKVIPYKWKDERYTVPLNLKEDAQKMLDEMAKPKVSYKTSVHDLSTLSGHEHESFELGDTVTAVDAELFDEEIVNRIVRRKQDVRRPENTEVELSQPSKTLADVQSRLLDDQIQTLVSSDPLSTTDVQQMTVFNQLLNSRADDGFSSWVHTANGTQFELANAGFSGSWSFKVTPDYGKDAQLTQTVEGVSHRSTYTISAAVATEGKITRGSDPNAFVGIKVLVYYEGEQDPVPFYLGIPDITTNEEGGA